MKQTKFEINQSYALHKIKNENSLLSWSMDKTFAACLIPLVNKYLKNSKKIVSECHFEMSSFETFLFKISSLVSKSNFVYIYLLEVAELRYIEKLKKVKDVLKDILEEESEEWKKKWGFKDLLPVKYDFYRPDVHEILKNTGPLVRMRVNSGSVDNAIRNKKIIEYNIKCFTKCIKWRKKYFNWLTEMIVKVWTC